MNAKTPVLLVLTTFFVLILCGAASAGTPLAENQTGTVSGDLYVNTTDGWPSSTQGATNIVTQANTLPTYTSIDSAWVYVNVYSGSGSSNWPVRTTVKLDGNGDGDYDDAGETLGVEDMNIPGSPDGTVYWLNDHCMRVYSDYQVWYNVTSLITSNNPTLYVKTENMGGDGYDGRIKLLALTIAYNDGDTDQVDYWVLNGQDWINASSSPSSSTFNTDQVPTGFTNATLNTVALSSTDGTYTLNTSSLTGNLTETGSYYKENQWDVTSYINAGADSTLTYANVGASLKLNLATLTIREATTTPAPIANFTATSTIGTVPLTVNFTNTSTDATTYQWDFNNDGTTDSTDTNPTYTYNTAGTYTVKLTATGPGGNDDETKTDYITVTAPVAPVAQFTGTPTTGTAPLQVTFTNQSIDATSYAWDFDNNGTTDSTDINPIWTYNTAGTYIVKLTATGPGGSDDEVKTDYINVNAPAVIADFTGTPTSGLAPLTVQFTDASTGATSWTWDFDNNGTTDSTDTNPTYTYTNAGSYTVKLTVTGPGGSDDETKTNYIAVIPENYSTYLGGSDSETGYSIAVDNAGNIYITGVTKSTNFPTTAGAYQTTPSGGYDTIVSKFNSGGALVYSTYLGRTGSEVPRSIAVDNAGNIFITGQTDSTDFPTTAGAYQTTYGGGTFDVFVSKFNSVGALVYSTFLGGADYDTGNDVAVDNNGNIYIIGNARSTNFPTTAGAYQTTYGGGTYDVFVSKFNSVGALIYSTYIGGTSDDWGLGAAVDNNGNIYITGYTQSTNFPITAGAYQTTHNGGMYDSFVSKFNSVGALVYSTYIGGTGSDRGSGIAADINENIYIIGNTGSTNFPTTAGAYQTTYAGGSNDIYLSKFNSSGTLVYSTYLGGTGNDSGYGIAADSSGNTYITGQTASTNFPTTASAYQTTYAGGSNDIYLSKFNSSGTLVYSTFLGGTGSDGARGIAMDNAGKTFITGQTGSTNFPTTAGAYQTTYAGGTYDVFVTKLKIEPNVAPVADFTATPTSGTAPLQVTFTNTSTDATSYAWDFDNNGTTDSTDQNPTWNYSTAGTYTVKLNATGPGGSDEEIKTDYITVSGTPDLIASDLQIPGTPIISTAYPVSATVTNSGNGDAISFTVKLYDNNTQVAKATLASLASGASTPVSFEWTPTTTGNHVLAVIADVNNEITESDEANNLVSTQITVNPSSQPDLTVTNLQLPSNPTIGTTSQVMVTVINNGTVDAGAFVVKLYDNNIQYTTINLTGLAAGASANVTFDWLTYTTGAHNLSVIADANQQITEYNESNNQLSQQAIVSQSTLPDLAVSNLQLPASPTVAINSQVTAIITNLGTVDSGAFVVKLYDNNTQIAKINLTGLTAGTSTDVTFDWLTYTTGAHNLSVIADANQQITEYNENNNQISQQATVNPATQPDLTVTDLQLPSNPVAGTTYQITATVTNLGTVDVGAFAVKLYDNNIQLGKINITSLSAGTSTQITFNWTPATGTHNLAIKTDANNQITEYNENNNPITQQITVS